MSESVRGGEKYSWIANEIRRRISTGQLRPGSQLPQRGELEESFQVSKVTLQRAMNLLIEDGFIGITRRKGSFVAERPPHLSRYALAFQMQPKDAERWSRICTAMVNEAARREREDGLSIPVYAGIDGHIDTEDYRRLMREVDEYRLAGVIYVADYPHPPELSFLRETGIPCVVTKGVPSADVPAVNIDEESFVHQALDHLAARGRKKIAFLGPYEYIERRRQFLRQELKSRDFVTYPYWMLGLSLETPNSARACTHLMMQARQEEIPDGLVILDDNLVEPATIGLIDAGMAVPEMMDVVAHANFPWKTPSVVEAKRLGFNVRSIMQACIANIDAQRRGEKPPEHTLIPAVFEP